ncbi:UDP-N-acetylmuramoylalanyl-D-glutamate--2,6-diaminopimelate ligase [Chitinophaga caeni]|uniref:UDP-N-acetylmuramoyl-tripeptide--D-alanyl-D-alanine ligase n=1 Tax=Chitinophaga caeni TaxID=2029983 RepID=A0A291QSU6_9BACT|nr:UDP-N-acetylmuramoyl-tripeptide--D-alanyl-D-alanine ligase [Chitinophaga caeni]ATL47040.1 UDP-N-acetylmuramoylalanyl-D-glutamate--2,6-diaminopimelate ligase [Chitinophaga caeni]
MNIPALYELYKKHPSVKTDTRQLVPGDLYFALKGPNFDGNAFAAQALGKGAVVSVIDDPRYFIDERKTIVVNNVLECLQALAKHHRQQLNIPFIAITGTNGKTTTKELINAVLSSQYKTVATKGNLNNHIGVPLTILSIPADTEMAIIEMGANHQREIAGYCEVALPTHGIITNIGKAHLEGFGGEEGVKIAKGELYDYLRANNGTVFVCKDLPYLVEMSQSIRQVTYGLEAADYVAKPVGGQAFLALETAYPDLSLIQTQLVGAYNYTNALAAIAVGLYFKVTGANIKAALEAYSPNNNRSQVIRKGNNTIIMDAYNANPSSMKAAIENFVQLDAGKKVLLLGAMKELGENSVKEHQALINLLQQHSWDSVLLVGGDFALTKHPYFYVENNAAAQQWYHQKHFENCYILVKGSRSIGMEKVIEDI